MRLVGGARQESRWLYAIAGALMIGGPTWQALYASHYPSSRPEAIFVPVAAALVGALCAVGARAIGGVIGSLVFGVLLLAYVDVQFDLQRWIYMWVVAVICMGLSLLLAAHRASITALALGAFYAASLVRAPIAQTRSQPDAARGPRADAPPLLVHLILDEQWGVGGIRTWGDTATAEYLTEFYRSRGFELYDAAYSRYQFTIASIPAMLSMGPPSRFTFGPHVTPYWRSLHEVPYFARLRELGYDVSIIQTTYLDYCHARVPVVSCTVEYGDAARNIAFLDGPSTVRARRIVRYLLNSRSHIYRQLDVDDEDWGRSIVGGGIAGAQHLSNAIAARPQRGTAIFAHLLLPHGPVDVDETCRIREHISDRAYSDDPQTQTDAAWRETLQLISGQIRCAHRLVDQVIAAIDSTVGRDGAIVIIQGDHGVRLPPRTIGGRGYARYSPEHLALAFPTLLAIRRPRVPAAVHREPVPVQDFLWTLARTGFVGPIPNRWTHYVRSEAPPSAPSDTMRVLGANEMLWVQR